MKVFTLAILAVLSIPAAEAATVVGKLESQAKPGTCLSRTSSDVVGSGCQSAPYVVMNCASSGWAGFVCTGRIKYHNTNLCVQAASTTIIQLATCNGSPYQNFRFANSGIRSDVHTSRYVTITSGNGIVLTALAANRILTYAQAWFLR